MPLLYEDIKFKRQFQDTVKMGYADTQTIIVNPSGNPSQQITITVTDIITKNPIANAQLNSGTNTVTTDTTGTATITLGTSGIIHISASMYLAKNVTPISDTVQASLIPLWLIGAGAASVAAIVIGVVLSGGNKGDK